MGRFQSPTTCVRRVKARVPSFSSLRLKLAALLSLIHFLSPTHEVYKPHSYSFHSLRSQNSLYAFKQEKARILSVFTKNTKNTHYDFSLIFIVSITICVLSNFMLIFFL